MVILLFATAAALLALCAEWLHLRRTRRVRWLAFGAAGGARPWVAAVPWIRTVGVGLLAWGLLTLLALDGAPADLSHKKHEPTRHLLIALDVSPSMYIQDSGPEAAETRGRRAYEVLESVLSRLDTSHTRVSVVAFYTTAKPVVVDTEDLNVVENILRDLPLEQAFKEGQTNMYEGVRAAGSLAAAWAPNSATLIVVSDGDTLPDSGLPRMPPSVSDTIVLGVGNPYRGTSIAGRTSRQDTASLKRLAVRLGGVYHDGNASQLPTAVIERLRMLTLEADQTTELRTVALVATGVGSSLLAALSPALAAAGVRHTRSRHRPQTRARITGAGQALSPST